MRIRLAALAAMLAIGTSARAQMPTGAQVVVPGSAVVNTSNPNAYVVTQTADKAIINWNSFSIGSGNSVRFVQPGSSSVILNRVVGNDPSNIFGSISANGQVFLVNPNGIYFAPGASVDVGGLVASTLNIGDNDFLSGNYLFARGDSAARAEVINAGVLKARAGGYVVLAGDYAANNGIVEAKLGTVMLGSAQSMTLDVDGDSLINYAMNARNLVDLAGVSNSGQLMADGGHVVMTAMTARSLTATAVNNTGLIQARGVADGAGGSVELLADGSGVALGSTSTIDVSGAGGGGTVKVGGDSQGGGTAPHASNVSMATGATINADATGNGNGGKVVLWSDGTTDFNGAISARGGANGGDGGNVEVSGQQLNFAGTVDTQAPQGSTGSLLLDPASITISNGTDTSITTGTPFENSDNTNSSILSVTTLQNALASSNVTVSTGGTTGTGAGTITVSDAVTWSSIYSLSLVANSQIAINAAVTGTNGTLALNAGSNQGATQSAAIKVGTLVLSGDGNFTLNNSNNNIGALSTQAQALGLGGTINQVNGNISLTTSGGLSLGTVTSTGTTTVNVGGDLTQSGALTASGLAVLSSTGVSMDLSNSGNNFNNLAVATSGATTITLGSTTTYSTSVGSTSGINTNNGNLTINVGSADFYFGANGAGAGTNVGSGTLTINANAAGRVYQYNNSGITADTVSVNTDSYVGLSGSANSVNTLFLNASGSNNPAASTTGDSTNGLAFDFLNNKTLTLGSATATTPISATNADVKIATNSGNLNLFDGADIDVGTGYLALEAANGTVKITRNSTVTAAAFGASGQGVQVDRDDSTGINNVDGEINAAAVAFSVNSGFAYTAAHGLTISSKIFDISGITANGDVYLNTGQFSGYTPGAAYSTYQNADSTYNAGLFLDGGINASGHTIYLNSASGIYQWGTSGGTVRDQAKIVANNLLVTGEGMFSLLDGNNDISTLAAYTHGSFMYGNSAPLTIDQLSFNSFGLSTVTLTGVKTTSALLGGGSDTNNAHNIQLSAADDPNSSSNVAMNIRQNVVANAESTHDSPSITLSVAASTAHPDALVETTNGAMVVGNSMTLGAQQGQGSFNITSNVASLAAAGGITTSIDDTAYTGTQNGQAAGTVLVFGLGSSGGGGAQAQVGDVFLQAHGITMTGGQSVGQWLLLRTDALTMLGSMQMADGARGVILQPLTSSYNIGVDNQYDPYNMIVNINYPRSLLQQFSQTTAFYVGATPQLLKNDYSGKSLPSWVTNYSYTGNIHIAGNNDGGLQLGYRSLSAETPGSIWAGNIGSLYNLRLVAPTVDIGGFNVTGTQADFFSDNLSFYGAAGSYKLVTQKGSSDTVVTLRSYSDPATIFIGNSVNSNYGGGLAKILFSFTLLDQLPDYTNIVVSGTTDSPLIATSYADILLAWGGQQSLGNRSLTISTPVWAYAYSGSTQHVFGHDSYSLASWNNAQQQPALTAVYSSEYSSGTSAYALGAAGGTWGGCPSITVCNPSTSTSSSGGGSTTGSGSSGGSGGGSGGTGSGSSGGSSGGPPAPPTTPTSTVTGDANSTGTSGSSNSSGTGTGDSSTGSTGTGGTTDTDPNAGMSGGGGSGAGSGSGSGSDTGSGSGVGSDSGGGSGSPGDSGTGSGASGSGTGSGSGSGMSGDGSGSGDDGSGMGAGASGNGGGEGVSGNGSGNGGDTGAGDMSASGDGSGAGSGSGSGSGAASGSGSGSGSGEGSSGAGSGAGNDGSGIGGSGSGNDNGSGASGSGSDGGGSGAASSGADNGSGGNGSGSGTSEGAGDSGNGGGNGSSGASNGGGSGDNGVGNGSGGNDNSGAGMSSDSGNGGGASASGDEGGGNASGEGTGSGAGNGSGQGAGSGDSGASNADAGANDNTSNGNGSNESGGGGAGSGHDDSSGMDMGDGNGNASRGQGSGGADESGASGKGGAGGQSGGETSTDASASNNGSNGAGNNNGASGAGGSSGSSSGTAANGNMSSTVCLGQKNPPRNQDLPEQGGSLSGKPLIGVHDGGVNMDDDCDRQQNSGAAGASNRH